MPPKVTTNKQLTGDDMFTKEMQEALEMDAKKLADIGIPHGIEFIDDEEDYFQCTTCKGRGTVNLLTAPDYFFCTGNSDCPDCDGSGKI